jgi:DNA-binding transcriptional MerR regulator
VNEEGVAQPARPAKRASAFRTIGEVSEELDLPPHVLRFWEAKFTQLTPLKRGGGRRYYRPEDIDLLRRIRQCLYQDGYTIRGVQKLLADLPGGGGRPAEAPQPAPSLFPLDAAAAPVAAREPVPARRPRRRAPAPTEGRDADHRAALEAIRRELEAARALIAGLPAPKQS